MAFNVQNVLAGLGAQGNSFELAWFADLGGAAVLPTNATSAPGTGWSSLGYIDENGLDVSRATQATDIQAYGAFTPIRTLIVSEKQDFKITGRETNLVSLALATRQKLSAVTASAGGVVNLTEGPARDVTYMAMFHATDGVNVIRHCLPSVRVTAIDDEKVAKASNVTWGYTLTAYPDSTGITVYSYLLLAGYGAS